MDLSRRDFLSKSLVGATAAVVAPAPVWAVSPSQYVMKFASPYLNDSLDFAPTAQLLFKKNVEAVTEGAVRVDVLDGGRAGVGTSLLTNVARNFVHAGIVSLSNMAPLAKQVDLLNIPFWSSSNQAYINLVSSQAWRNIVVTAGNAVNIDILYHCAVGARTASATKKFGKVIKTPEDIRDIRFRVPGSEVLHKLYSACGADVRRVAWGVTGRAASDALIDGLDPSVSGLYIGPGKLKDYIYSVSLIESVHDGWACVTSKSYLDNLPRRISEQIREAADMTAREQVTLATASTAKAQAAFESMGVDIYAPTDEEKQAWKEAVGADEPIWDDFKVEFAGSIRNFDIFRKAAETMSDIIVPG